MWAALWLASAQVNMRLQAAYFLLLGMHKNLGGLCSHLLVVVVRLVAAWFLPVVMVRAENQDQ
jgi:hypothetical protein